MRYCAVFGGGCREEEVGSSGRKDEDEAVGDGGRKLLEVEHRVTGCRRKRLLPQVWPRQVAGVLQS